MTKPVAFALRAVPVAGFCAGIAWLATAPAPVHTVVVAGSTQAAPIMQQWTIEYSATHRATAKGDGALQIQYNAIGSGKGVQALLDGEASAAVTDSPITDEQRAELVKKLGPIAQVPITNTSIAIDFELKHIDKLRLDGPTLTGIFSGRITRWNDPAIAALNPHVKLPKIAIHPVRRSDNSGATEALSEYLARNSPDGEKLFGIGQDAKLKGEGAEGTPALAATVESTVGAIGYVPTAYAMEGKEKVASLPDGAGNFVSPTADTYPAVSASYAVFARNGKNAQVQRTLEESFAWDLEAAQQKKAERSGFTPLNAIEAQSGINNLTADGVQQYPETVQVVHDPVKSASQVAEGCAINLVAGQTAPTLEALYQKPALPGQHSWTRAAAGEQYTSCVEGSAPKGPRHGNIVHLAENGLGRDLSILFNMRRGKLEPVSAAKLASMDRLATKVADKAATDVWKVNAAKVASSGPVYVIGEASKLIGARTDLDPLVRLSADAKLGEIVPANFKHQLELNGV